MTSQADPTKMTDDRRSDEAQMMVITMLCCLVMLYLAFG